MSTERVVVDEAQDVALQSNRDDKSEVVVMTTVKGDLTAIQKSIYLGCSCWLA